MELCENTKLELAVDIMALKIAQAARQGYDLNGEYFQNLLNEKVEMYKCNDEILDKVINVYGKEVLAYNGDKK